MKGNVLIGGGSGLIGRRLTKQLIAMGYSVAWLTSSGKSEGNIKCYQWNYLKGEMDLDAVKGVDYIFNFAGVGIVDKPWTPERKKEIIDSRTTTAKMLLDAVKKTNQSIKGYFSASAIGYYGDTGDQWVDETHTPSTDFLGVTCGQWESAATTFSAAGIRTGMIRIGIVLANEGGALPELMRGIKFGFASYLGNGNQYYSWIHIDDLCREFIYLMENDNLNGAFNGVAPNPVANKELVRQISHKKTGRAILFPVPGFVLSIMLGTRKVTVLDSCKVSSEKIQKAGFKFEYPELNGALEELLLSKTKG